MSVAVLLLTMTACGTKGSNSGSTVAVDPVRWIDGEIYSSDYALQVVEAPGVGAVVVDTAVEVDGVRRVQARWSGGSGAEVATDDERPALITPWAWVGNDRVFVAGDVCAEPALGYTDRDGNDFGDMLDSDRRVACGVDPWVHVIRVLDLTDGTWSELETIIPGVNGESVNVAGWGPTSAVFGGAAEDDANERVLYRVDLITGARTTLNGPAEGLGMCPSGGGHLAFRSGTIDAEGRVPSGTFSVVTDTGIRQLVGDVGGSRVKLGCSDDALVLWSPKERAVTVARYSEGTVAQSSVPLPFKHGIRTIAQRNLGGPVAVWEDRRTSFQVWILRDGTWHKGGTAVEGPDPPSVVAVVNGLIVGATTDLVLRIRN